MRGAIRACVCFVVMLSGMFVRGVFADDVVSGLPEGTCLVVRADLVRLRESNMYGLLENKFFEQFNLFKGFFGKEAGIDLDELESLWLAAVKKDDGMLLLKGKFDVGEIKAALDGNSDCRMVSREGCELAAYIPDKRRSAENLAVLLDDETLVIGNPAYVDSYMMSFFGKSSRISPEKSLKAISALSGDSVLQAVVVNAPVEWEKSDNHLLASLAGGSGKLDIAEKIECAAEIEMDSAESAEALTQILLGMVAMQRFKQARNPDAAILKDDVLKNLKIRQDGQKVMLDAWLSEGLVEYLIEKIGK